MTANPDPTAAGESAIIVPVDVPVAVRRLRDRFDPSAAQGVPAHVTLLYPFMPPDALTGELRAELARVIATEATFPLTFARVERWPDVVWLAPEPDAPFRRLIERLSSAFPDFPPYGGIHAEVVPHVTIAHDEREDWLAAAAHALPGLLPIRDVVREAHLIVREPGAKWRTLWRLPLGRAD